MLKIQLHPELPKKTRCVFYKHMPGQLQLCLQLTFIPDAGFKGLMEQSQENKHIYVGASSAPTAGVRGGMVCAAVLPQLLS